jgi:hypothetical protein
MLMEMEILYAFWSRFLGNTLFHQDSSLEWLEMMAFWYEPQPFIPNQALNN